MRDVDAEQNQAIDNAATHIVGLLRTGLRERLFGSVTVTYHWKAGVLSKRVVHEESTELLLQPQQN